MADTKMKRLDPRDFRKPRTLASEDVEIEDWGGFVTVREMSGAERDEFDEFVLKSREEGKVSGVRAVIVSICCVDGNGKRMFTNLDIPDLQKQSARIITQISDVGMRLSGLSADEVEDRSGNSESGPESDSSSDSADNSE